MNIQDNHPAGILTDFDDPTLQGFFDDYVKGTQVIPLGDYLLKVGIELVRVDGEAPSLRSLDQMSESQRRLREAIFVNQ